LQDERIDESAGNADAVVRGQRRAQCLQIVDEILHRAVGRQACVSLSWLRASV